MLSAEQKMSAMSCQSFISQMNKMLMEFIDDIKQIKSQTEVENKSMDMIQKVVNFVRPGYRVELVSKRLNP